MLSDADARAAEALIAGQWDGKTPTQIRNKIARAVVQVDPEGAARRREEAEREEARVEFWRQNGDTAALAGYGLPTDAALMANANIQNRALAYKAHGVPGTLDQLRVLARLDSINGTDARTRHPQAAACQDSEPAKTARTTGTAKTAETGTGTAETARVEAAGTGLGQARRSWGSRRTRT